MGRTPEQHRLRRHGGGELRVGAGLGEGAVGVLHGHLQQAARRAVGLLVAQLDHEQLVLVPALETASHGLLLARSRLVAERPRPGDGPRHGLHLVQHRDLVTRAQLAAVLRVVGKVPVAQRAVLVPDQPIGPGARRVELHLRLHVLGDGHEGGLQLLAQDLPRLLERVDVGVLAVPLVGEQLHGGVLVVAHAVAQDGEEDARARLLGDEVQQLVVAGRADVEVAVGAEEDAVDVLGVEVSGGEGVGGLDAGAAMGAVAGLQPVDDTGQRGLARRVHGRGFRQHLGARRVGDEGDAVAGPKPIQQQAQRPLHQRQLVLGSHRSAHVHQEHEVRRGPRGALERPCLDPHAHQLASLPPRRLRHLHRDRHRMLRTRLRVRIPEVVDHLLHPHGVARRQRPLAQEAPHVGVAGRVHVEAERRKRGRRHRPKVVLDDRRVALARRLDQGAVVPARFHAHEALLPPFAALRPAEGVCGRRLAGRHRQAAGEGLATPGARGRRARQRSGRGCGRAGRIRGGTKPIAMGQARFRDGRAGWRRCFGRGLGLREVHLPVHARLGLVRLLGTHGSRGRGRQG